MLWSCLEKVIIFLVSNIILKLATSLLIVVGNLAVHFKPRDLRTSKTFGPGRITQPEVYAYKLTDTAFH